MVLRRKAKPAEAAPKVARRRKVLKKAAEGAEGRTKGREEEQKRPLRKDEPKAEKKTSFQA
jgi:hypothetical protein